MRQLLAVPPDPRTEEGMVSLSTAFPPTQPGCEVSLDTEKIPPCPATSTVLLLLERWLKKWGTLDNKVVVLLELTPLPYTTLPIGSWVWADSGFNPTIDAKNNTKLIWILNFNIDYTSFSENTSYRYIYGIKTKNENSISCGAPAPFLVSISKVVELTNSQCTTP